MSEQQVDSLWLTMEFMGAGRAAHVQIGPHDWVILQSGYGVLTAQIRLDDAQTRQWLEDLDSAAQNKLGARWMYHQD